MPGANPVDGSDPTTWDYGTRPTPSRRFLLTFILLLQYAGPFALCRTFWVSIACPTISPFTHASSGSVFFACGTGALIIPTPLFLMTGLVRLNFTKEASDPISAYFNMMVPSNGSRLADNVDLSTGFVDVRLDFLPGTYEIFAFDNDDSRTLGSTGDFALIETPTPITVTPSAPARTPTSSAASSPPASSAPPRTPPATPPPDIPPSSSSPNASPRSSASSIASSAASLPTSLPASPPASLPASLPASSTTTSTASSTQNSGTAVAGQTAPPSTNAVAKKSQPSTGIIATVVICVLLLLAGLIFIFFFFRRRKQRTRRRDSRGTLEAPAPMAQSSLALIPQTYPSTNLDPFTSPVSTSTSLTSPQQRQQHITNEMRLLRKQMEELRRTNNSTSSTSFSSSVPESSAFSPTQTSPTSTHATSALDLERSRQQNDELQSRIAQLEAQLQSAWALGLSNEPPPGYVA
ncbi:hypothetical protein DFH09DRAFT_1481700 [Mycena vulgaris]|nr:hypothetical protein DFH09DRAFT_1481700 [Mycena vulgaris]